MVFECRALFEETFYLCGSCRKTFPIKLICEHIVGARHQHTYMVRVWVRLRFLLDLFELDIS